MLPSNETLAITPHKLYSTATIVLRTMSAVTFSIKEAPIYISSVGRVGYFIRHAQLDMPFLWCCTLQRMTPK
jgi:hypothetical protein